MPYLLVTNTSLVSRPSLGGVGSEVGFATPPDRLQSALSASAELVRREYGDRPVFVIASDDARTEFAGLNVVDAAGARDAAPGEVAAVVLGDSPDQLTKANLDLAFRLVRGGAELIGMHRNPGGSRPRGRPSTPARSSSALEWATGRRARTVGKPSPAFFRVAIDRLAAEAAARGEPRLRRSELAMVGDDVGSDIRGGRRAGLRTIFVRSGKHGDAELAARGFGSEGLRAGRGRGAIREVVAALS